MPGFNGTGPQGNGPMSGRRFGRCRTIATPAQESEAAAQPAQEDTGGIMSQGPAQNITIYGRGRGGVPCGCGRGYGFGGGRRLQE